MIKYLKSVFLVIFLINTIKPCSLSSGFKYPTFEENFESCGAVILGKVKQKITNQPNDPYIWLNNVRYFKGCGPRRVKVKGYSSGTKCSVSPPSEGNDIIVFVCKKNEEDFWRLNTFRPFAGQLDVRATHLKKLFRRGVNKQCDFENFEADSCKALQDKSEKIIIPTFAEKEGNDESELDITEILDSVMSDEEKEDDLSSELDEEDQEFLSNDSESLSNEDGDFIF